jgi:tellurite resistance protein
MFKAARALPLARIIAAAQVAMLARRHFLHALTPHERRRMLELVRRGRHLSAAERRELRNLAAKLPARAFATDAARTLAPFGRGPGRGKRH